MHPYTADRMTAARHHDLVQRARSARQARAATGAGRRRSAGQRVGWLLVHAGLRLAVGRGGTAPSGLDPLGSPVIRIP